MKLDSKTVENIFRDCLFSEGEDVTNAVVVSGVISQFGFNQDRLSKHKTEIKELLEELPDEFQSAKGGGWSFLDACMTKSGDQWGEHRNIEQLLTLGIATKQASILLPRAMWPMMPGGMPYFSVGTQSEQAVS